MPKPIELTDATQEELLLALETHLSNLETTEEQCRGTLPNHAKAARRRIGVVLGLLDQFKPSEPAASIEPDASE